jgi:peroxiredoxin
MAPCPTTGALTTLRNAHNEEMDLPDLTEVPHDLPVPLDDGAADHLVGLNVPHVPLQSTSGHIVDVSELASDRCVLFFYPRMGRPGEELPAGWDSTPGARGCTPQSCAFRDRHEAFTNAGYEVAGVSSQGTDAQIEATSRLHLPFQLLSDPELILASEIGLPTFEISGMELYKRLTLVAEGGKMVKVFYPVFPPQHNAAEVLAWLRMSRADKS